MSEAGRPRPPGRPLRRGREQAVEALKRLYSEDELTVDELEDRLDRCYRAGSLDELEALFSDLPARLELEEPPGGRREGDAPPREGPEAGAGRRETGAGPRAGRRRGSGREAEAPEEGPAPDTAGAAPPARRDRHDLVLAVLGGVKRSGRWTPPRHMNVLAVMGGAELDFRHARFPPGVTSVHAVAVMGGVHVVVPPGLRVESAGVPLLGGFDRLDQDGDGESFPGAVLRIRGLACMGGVEVEVKAPGA